MINPSDAHWARIKDLFSEAVALAPAVRQTWIARACGDDAALRREVEALVQAHDAAGAFLDAPALASPEAARVVVDASALAAADHSPPDRFGAYRILRELGRGGMGVVYLGARDDDRFEKLVAIKVVSGDLTSPPVLQRFHEERRILASLDHPNIARLLDAGTTDAGRPYVVMEYVEGESLDAYCTARRLPVRERLRLFALVCAAVQYSHQHLVVHRDIKARNILVTADGVPKLLDFGIAKLVEPGGGERDRTRTAFRALTPESASPEQVRGEPVTVATDVYSLGVLLYRLLADRSPYRGNMQTESGIVRAICEEEPVRPSDALADAEIGPAAAAAVTPVLSGRELRGDLDLITLKALKKEPARRYTSVERLAEDVWRHLDNRPVRAVPDAWTYRARKFLSRNRLGAAAAAITIAAIAAATVVSVHQARVAQRQRAAAQLRFEMVRKLANAVVFDFNDALAAVPGATAARKLIVGTAIDYLDALSRDQDTDATLMREVAAAYVKIGDIQGSPLVANLNDPDGSRASYQHALTVYQRLAGLDASPETRAGMAQVHAALGLSDWSRGDGASALTQYAEMRRLNEDLAASAPSVTSYRVEMARADYQTGQVYLMLGDAERARQSYQRSVSVSEGLVEADAIDLSARRTLAVGYLKLGDVAQLVADSALAAGWYRRAERIALELNRLPDAAASTARLVVFTRLRLAEALKDSDAVAAERLVRSVLPGMEAASHADRANAQAVFDLGYASTVLGDAVLAQRRPADAVSILERAADGLRRGLAVNPRFTDARRDYGLALRSLGEARLGVREFTGAIAVSHEALSILEAPDIRARAMSDTARLRQTLGDAHAGVAQTARAERARAAARASAADEYQKSASAWTAIAATRPLSARERASHERAVRAR